MLAKKLNCSSENISFRNISFRSIAFRNVSSGILLPLLWFTAFFLLLNTNSLRSPMMMDVVSLALLSIHARLINRTPLTLSSVLLLFPLLLTEMNGLGLNCVFLSFGPFISFFFLIDLSLIIWWQQGCLRKYALGISLTTVTGCLMLIGKELLQNRLTYFYYQSAALHGWGPIQKTLIFFSVSLAYLILVTEGGKQIGRLLRKQCPIFQRLYQKLEGIELYVLLLTAIFLIPLTVLPYSAFLYLHREHMLSGMSWIYLFFFLIALVCICFFAKTVLIKEKIQVIHDEKEILSAYTEDLESNLAHMKEIRHDTKNLFLTMAGFVERSGDLEMKEFYHRNITPFLRDSLVKNELLDQLKQIKNDQLKSFFYYKLASQLDAGIPVKLNVSSTVNFGAGCSDLVRLLGIFLDNAGEEAALAHGSIQVTISEVPAGTGIRIENSVRRETRTRGVVPGVTDKGSGRGNGLLIARKVIRKYRNLRLNSYFTESGFVQYLLIATDC